MKKTKRENRKKVKKIKKSSRQVAFRTIPSKRWQWFNYKLSQGYFSDGSQNTNNHFLTYSLNGLYGPAHLVDTVYTGGYNLNVQPPTYDMWLGATAFFQQYRVVGAKVTMRVTNKSIQDAQTVCLVMRTIQDHASTPDISDPAQNDLEVIPKSQRSRIARLSTNNLPQATQTIVKYFDFSKLVNKEQLYGDVTFGGLYNQYPNNEILMDIVTYGEYRPRQTFELQYSLSIDYLVLLDNPDTDARIDFD